MSKWPSVNNSSNRSMHLVRLWRLGLIVAVSGGSLALKRCHLFSLFKMRGRPKILQLALEMKTWLISLMIQSAHFKLNQTLLKLFYFVLSLMSGERQRDREWKLKKERWSEYGWRRETAAKETRKLIKGISRGRKEWLSYLEHWSGLFAIKNEGSPLLSPNLIFFTLVWSLSF